MDLAKPNFVWYEPHRRVAQREQQGRHFAEVVRVEVRADLTQQRAAGEQAIEDALAGNGVARSGEEALEVVSIAAPALVITELVLPGMNGSDLFDRITRNPAMPSAPV